MSTNNLNIEEPGLKKYLLTVATAVLSSLVVYIFVIWGIQSKSYALAGLYFFTLVACLVAGFKRRKKGKIISEMFLINFLILNWVSCLMVIFNSIWWLATVLEILFFIIISGVVYIILSQINNQQWEISKSTLWCWSVMEVLILMFAVLVINSQFTIS